MRLKTSSNICIAGIYLCTQDRFAEFVQKVMNAAAKGHTLQTLKVGTARHEQYRMEYE